MYQPSVSVIVAVKNQPSQLRNCLLCLKNQDYPGFYEVIVVDNASDCNIASICDEFGAIYQFEARPGAYVCRNRGLQCARGQIIAFTDADCSPWSNWLSGAVWAMEVFHLDIVAGLINFTFSADPPPIGEYLDSIVHLNQRQYAAMGYGAGANLIARRVCFDLAGEFRSNLVNLGDREWCQRAVSLGCRLDFSILAVVDHPARSWWPLLQKLWRQTRWKHHLQPFMLKSVLAALGPMEIENYAAVWADPNVPGLCGKARLLLGMHFLRWLEAIRIAQLLLGRG